MPRGNSISDHITTPTLKNTSLRNHPSQNEVVPKGLKVELKGRLRGAAKSKKLSNIKGSVKSQSIDYYIEYNKKEIYTK